MMTEGNEIGRINFEDYVINNNSKSLFSRRHLKAKDIFNPQARYRSVVKQERIYLYEFGERDSSGVIGPVIIISGTMMPRMGGIIHQKFKGTVYCTLTGFLEKKILKEFPYYCFGDYIKFEKAKKEIKEKMNALEAFLLARGVEIEDKTISHESHERKTTTQSLKNQKLFRRLG